MTQNLIRILFVCIALSIVSVANANSSGNYSGVWEDNWGQRYTINQSKDSIVVAELIKQKMEMSTFLHGNIEFSENPLDLVVNSIDYFALELSDGSVSYIRSDQFMLSDEGWIVNKDGYRLRTEKGNSLPSYVVNQWKEDNEKLTIALKECGDSWECLVNIEINFDFSISGDGVISLVDKESGDLVEFDRIPLASIYLKHLRESGRYFISTNPDAVHYFYPADSLWANYIGTGGLEVNSSHTFQVWLGYTGVLVNHLAVLKASTELKNTPNYWEKQEHIGELRASVEAMQDERYWKEIYFSSDSSAVIEIKCHDEFLQLCDEKNFADRLLTKIL